MPEQPQDSSWSRNWKWMVPVGCLTPVLLCGGFLTFVMTLAFGVMKSSVPYTQSLEAVKAHPQAQRELGDPIEPGFIVTGSVNLCLRMIRDRQDRWENEK